MRIGGIRHGQVSRWFNSDGGAGEGIRVKARLRNSETSLNGLRVFPSLCNRRKDGSTSGGARTQVINFIEPDSILPRGLPCLVLKLQVRSWYLARAVRRHDLVQRY